MELGQTVYTVIKVSRYLASVWVGQVIVAGEKLVCLTDGNRTWFCPKERAFPDSQAAEACKKALEAEATP